MKYNSYSFKSDNLFRVLVLILILITIGLGLWFFRTHWQGQEAETDIVIEEIPTTLGTVYQLNAESQIVVDQIKSFEDQVKLTLPQAKTETINQAVMAMIRKDRYGYGSAGLEKIMWGRFAGTLDSETGLITSSELFKRNLLQTQKQAVLLSDIEDPVSSDPIDTIHMIAVADLYDTATLVLPYQERYYDALFSWAGDLESFTLDVLQAKLVTDKDFRSYISNNLGQNTTTRFSRADFLANIDGVNLCSIMKADQCLLSEALNTYYNGGKVGSRKGLFIEAIGGQQVFSAMVDAFMLGTTEAEFASDEAFDDFIDGVMTTRDLMIRAMAGSDSGVQQQLSKSQRAILGNAFKEMHW